MSYLVNAAITDTFLLRDNANAALTGKVDGDFATLEAYLLTSPTTTAAATTTEIGTGEYAVAFTPSAVGTWTLHVVYDVGATFREFSETYAVEAAGGSQVAASLVTATVSSTVRDVRRAVQELLGDLITLTLTEGGSTGTLIDETTLFDSNDSYVGSHLYFVSGTAANVGRLARCDGSTQDIGALGFTPAVPSATAAGDVVDLHNLHGDGWRRSVIVNRIARGLEEAYPEALVVREDVLADAFDQASPLITVPDDVTHNSAVWWADTDGIYQEVPPAHRIVNRAAATIELVGQSRWDADTKTVRLSGYGKHPSVSAETDPIYLDPRWLKYEVAADLGAKAADKALRQWAVEWFKLAQSLRENMKTSLMPNTERVR